MAYYGYNGDVDERYSSNYGHVLVAASPPYDPGEPNLINEHSFGTAYQYSSAYDLGEPNLIDYSSPPYYTDDYSASAYSNPINYTCYDYSGYSVNQLETFYSQPKYLQYDPPPHYQGFSPSQTKFTVSYSKVEPDEPEFPEYDPTPYGGGYDQTSTYGKPHPPSDLTCYPRSLPQSDAPPENFSFASIPSPYGRDDEPPIKSPNRSKLADTKAESGRDNSYVESGGHVNDDGKDVEPKDVIPNGDGNIGKDVEPKDVILSGGYPSIEHQNGFNVPYGAGLEAMDICESLFGYWPCVAKKAEQERNSCQVCKPDSRMDPWKPAADYLFGSPVPYDSYYYTHHHQFPYQSDQISWLHHSMAIIFITLSLTLLLFSSSSTSTSTSSIHELLKSRGLPGGLFPKNGVKSYEVSEDGVLEVFLESPCVAKFETRISFESVVRANLSYGGLMGVQGLSQEELFLWLPVKDIIVYDPASGLILFDIGLAHKQMSLSLFEDPPLCYPTHTHTQTPTPFGLMLEKKAGIRAQI